MTTYPYRLVVGETGRDIVDKLNSMKSAIQSVGGLNYNPVSYSWTALVKLKKKVM